MSELTTEPCDFGELRRTFTWRLPARLNMAWQVCGRHALGPSKPALIDPIDGRVTDFQTLERLASRLAHTLKVQGIGRGDRVAVLLGQRVETAALHIAVWKLGAVSLPLFLLFGDQALAFRLQDSGAKLIVTDHEGAAKLARLRDQLPDLSGVLDVDGPSAGALGLPDLLECAHDEHGHADTTADAPAVMIYTSGTTGNPKGALHGHRVLAGHLPGVQLSHDLLPQLADRMWTPADWAWIGGLFDVLMPALYFGLPVVMQPAGRFDPEQAMDLIARHNVRNTFLPPTALRLLREAGGSTSGLVLRSIASGGERLGEDVLAWAKSALSITVNEFYGQTECNMIISNCARLIEPKPGAMGLAVPGHEVEILNDQGQPLGPGEVGDIGVKRNDPVMFLNYWRNGSATLAKFRGDWLITGDRGSRDENGFFTFFGRDDDIIAAAGYRIGPAEIEACLCTHPAVAQAAVIGVADALRGERIQAHLILRPGHEATQTLTAALQDYVRVRLAAHEVPREIIYPASLPLTATGKIRRGELRAQARAKSG